ncbi:unnamed protein product [Closterium sp. NIES-53]
MGPQLASAMAHPVVPPVTLSASARRLVRLCPAPRAPLPVARLSRVGFCPSCAPNARRFLPVVRPERVVVSPASPTARVSCCPHAPCCPRALQPASPAAPAHLVAPRALLPCASSAPCCPARPAALRTPRALLPCVPRVPCCSVRPAHPAAQRAPRALLRCMATAMCAAAPLCKHICSRMRSPYPAHHLLLSLPAALVAVSGEGGELGG